jgi:hypothetical protein
MSDRQNNFNPIEWITTKEAAELMGYASAKGDLHATRKGVY